MRSSFAIIRSGILDYLLRGEIGYRELGIYVAIHLQADFKTGIWWGSAPRLLSGSQRAMSLRQVQRSMQILRRARLLRPFHVLGVRSNYPVLINKYEVKIGTLKGKRLNAWASASWQKPTYESCVEADALDDAVDDIVAAVERAPYQYPRRNIQEAVPPSNVPSSDGIKLAAHLRERILINNPTARISKRQERGWAMVADLMIRVDDRPPFRILELMDWAEADPFWRTNILSMSKLREKFDQLTIKMNTCAKGGFNRAEQRDIDNLRIAGFRVS